MWDKMREEFGVDDDERPEKYISKNKTRKRPKKNYL